MIEGTLSRCRNFLVPIRLLCPCRFAELLTGVPYGDQQNRQGKYFAAFALPDRGDSAVLCPVAADGALFLFLADFVFRVLLRKAARDSYRVRLRIPRNSAG